MDSRNNWKRDNLGRTLGTDQRPVMQLKTVATEVFNDDPKLRLVQLIMYLSQTNNLFKHIKNYCTECDIRRILSLSLSLSPSLSFSLSFSPSASLDSYVVIKQIYG